jgi:peptidoglycan-associated lipoprotein
VQTDDETFLRRRERLQARADSQQRDWFHRGLHFGVFMKTVSVLTIASLSVLGCFSTACGHAEKPAEAPTTVTSTASMTSSSPGKGSSTIYLSDRLRQACNLTTIESMKEAPKFAFDESDIQPDDRDVLAQVAQCLTTGPLKGQSVKLVGRADPRGTQEYNMALGARRSSAVGQYLQNLGVANSQLTDTSRGAIDATGDDPTAWQKDRRVDIDLAGSGQ